MPPPPSSFLPPLPPQSRNTLHPLSPPDLIRHITHLRLLLIPEVYGTGVEKDNEDPLSTSMSSLKGFMGEYKRKSAALSSSLGTSASSSGSSVVMDEFERDWSEKWLHGIISRGEGWLAEVEPEDDVASPLEGEEEEDELDMEDTRYKNISDEERQVLEEKWKEYNAREEVLEAASALISSLAGCASGGGITRTLPFPLAPGSDGEQDEILLHTYDAPLSDHTSVGVQTWGSAILLGRQFAKQPERYLSRDYDFEEQGEPSGRGNLKGEDEAELRILELGAGTGVMSILCRLILDHIHTQTPTTIVATDYHPLVLANLHKCINLNIPTGTDGTTRDEGPRATLKTALLDWNTFPELAEGRREKQQFIADFVTGHTIPINGSRVPSRDWALPPELQSEGVDPASDAVVEDIIDRSWDVIIAADCVYDLSHAGLIRESASWCLRLPEVEVGSDGVEKVMREGGVLHLLSPIRPTYAAETDSIVQAFPSASSLPSRTDRKRLQAEAALPPAIETLTSKLAKLTNGNGSGRSTGRSSPMSVPSARRGGSGYNTPTRHIPSTRVSGTATPITGSGTVNASSGADSAASGSAWVSSGRGEVDGWVLATRKRREMERMRGSGRSDEVEYWWWEIGWV